ncbi:MAG: hypothetical protein QOF03_741 [Alphaproteobacteria bacterium]|jgi:hypothetical protein|nr:hypothetical protein [Alphaproteobacteria bacterium]
MISQIQSAAATVRTDVMAALHAASHKTGLDFDYLFNTAMRESSLNTQAKSKSSSASGLFQFIDQTWLGLVKQYGGRYGLGSYASAIQQTSDGHYVVASNDTKAAILALRQDPEMSAVMAGESAKQTKQTLECALGRTVCAGELYAAHFLGTSGARHLIQLSETNPNMRADVAFPQVSKGNKSMFFHADGTAKTVGELYASVVNRPPQQMPAPPANPPQLQMAVATSDFADIGNVLRSVSDTQSTDASQIAADDPAQQPALRGNSHALWTTPDRPPVAPALRPLPQTAVVLSPGIVEVLASLTPVAINRRAA